MRVVMFFFLMFFSGLVSAQDGSCADTDNNPFIRLAMDFQELVITSESCRPTSETIAEYFCDIKSNTLPEGFRVVFSNDTEYITVSVFDVSHAPNRITAMGAPWIETANTPAHFYGTKTEVIGTMSAILGSGPDSPESYVKYDSDF